MAIQKEDQIDIEMMLKAFRVDFAEAVAALETQYKCKIALGNITYDAQSFRSKLEVVMQNEDGVVETKERIDYKSHCRLFDLKPEWLGRSFAINDKTWTVVGLKPRATKRPVVVQAADGKEYVFRAVDVIRAIVNTAEEQWLAGKEEA